MEKKCSHKWTSWSLHFKQPQTLSDLKWKSSQTET